MPERRLVAVRTGAAERIVIQRAASERAEAELVVHTLERLLGGTLVLLLRQREGGHAEMLGISPSSDVAILYRTEAQTPPLVEALGRRGHPVPEALPPSAGRAVGGEGADPRAAGSRRGGEPGRGAPRPGRRGARRRGRRSRPLGSSSPRAICSRPLAIRAGVDLDAFLAEIALGGEVDAWDPRAERVSLLTLHASKGLEFPVVFLVGCEDGLLPFCLARRRGAADAAEERRLFFVGITRACSRLFLFHSRKRTSRGEAAETRPSPFLADLAEALLDRRDEPVLAPRRPEQLRLL